MVIPHLGRDLLTGPSHLWDLSLRCMYACMYICMYTCLDLPALGKCTTLWCHAM